MVRFPHSPLHQACSRGFTFLSQQDFQSLQNTFVCLATCLDLDCSRGGDFTSQSFEPNFAETSDPSGTQLLQLRLSSSIIEFHIPKPHCVGVVSVWLTNFYIDLLSEWVIDWLIVRGDVHTHMCLHMLDSIKLSHLIGLSLLFQWPLPPNSFLEYFM